MNVGTCVHAPDGCKFFEKGLHYYFLASCDDPCRVLLVRFFVKKAPHGLVPERATIVTLARADFEEECITGRIHATEKQPSLPEWLVSHGDNEFDLRQRDATATAIDQRRQIIQPAVDAWEGILRDRQPTRRINDHARKCGKNERRFRLWLLTFLVFGRKRDALAPGFGNCGRWERVREKPTRKQGRPSLSKGRHSGRHLRAVDIELIKQAYLKLRGLQRNVRWIYHRALTRYWKCTLEFRDGELHSVVQPDGEPVPTYNQFRYRLKKLFGSEQIAEDRFGPQRTRNRVSANRGSFTERVTNLMARVEFDAFTVPAYPVGLDGTVLPPLHVVRARDTLSGMIVGIGFSLGGERMTAYCMALFCCAVPKRYFCQLFGISINEDEWPSMGLPSGQIFDWGPGSMIKDIAPIREISVSWSGQSKSISETSHEKADHIEGRPSYVSSGKTSFQLAAAIIEQTILFNKVTNVSSRLTPDMKLRGIAGTPLAIWNDLDRRGRNSSIRIDLDHAVRTFLPKMKATCTADGILYRGALFRSEALLGSGLLEQAKQHRFEVETCVLPMSARQIWLDHRGQLLELKLSMPFPCADSETHLTLDDLALLSRQTAAVASDTRDARAAHELLADRRYEETFGVPLDSGVRVNGRPQSKTAEARRLTRLIDPRIPKEKK